MRTFTCFIYDAASAVPTLSFILARDEIRAQELARRELMDALRPVAVELHEAGRLLWREVAERSAPVVRTVRQAYSARGSRAEARVTAAARPI